MNPKAGSASTPGCNNAAHNFPIADVSGAYRAQDGPVIGNLGARLRVKGSQPGIDPRDPQNNSQNVETVGDTAAHG